jgi:hypothetical protein
MFAWPQRAAVQQGQVKRPPQRQDVYVVLCMAGERSWFVVGAAKTRQEDSVRHQDRQSRSLCIAAPSTGQASCALLLGVGSASGDVVGAALSKRGMHVRI